MNHGGSRIARKMQLERMTHMINASKNIEVATRMAICLTGFHAEKRNIDEEAWNLDR
jgi:hypothetical protein